MRHICKDFLNYRVYRNVYGHTAVVRGSLDAAFEIDVAEWDIVATRILVEEAGGRFVEFRRELDELGRPRIGAAFGTQDVVARILKSTVAK